MLFANLFLCATLASASVELSPEDSARLKVGDSPAFVHALDVLEGPPLSHYYLHGQLPGAAGEILNVFHLVARLNSLEVAQLFLRVAIQDPILGFWLIAGVDVAGPDHYFPLSVMNELVHNPFEAFDIVRALNRTLRAYESVGQIDAAAMARFELQVYNRLARILGRLEKDQQDDFAAFLALHKKSLDEAFYFRLQGALALADHFRCLMALALVNF